MSPAPAYRIAPRAHYASGVVLGGGAAIALAAFFLLPAPLHLLLPAALAGLCWVYLSYAHPLPAFLILLGTALLLYYRLMLSGDDGGLAIVDLLWAVFFGSWLLRAGITAPTRVPRVPFAVITPLLPYTLLSFLLPILGVALYLHPLSFAIPGLRLLEWVSFAFIAYDLAARYGEQRLRTALTWLLTAVLLIHGAYAVVQMGARLGMLPAQWLYFDNLIVGAGKANWFTPTRSTGLMLNPNVFGHLTVMLVFFFLARFLAAGRSLASLLCATFALILLLLSGSRSGLVGVAVGVLLVLFSLPKSHRILRQVVVSAVAIGLALAMLWPFAPVALQQRFARFSHLLSTQDIAQDSSMSGRVHLWTDAWQAAEARYPLGTLVPPSYALESPIDGYLVFSAVMGTPLYTVLFLVMLWHVGTLARVTLRRCTAATEQVIPLMLIGWTGGLLGSSFTSSPMLLPHVLMPFWACIGLLLWQYTQPFGAIAPPARRVLA